MLIRIGRWTTACMIGISFLFGALPLGATTYSVTPDADSDCSDLTCDLRSALNAASANDEGDTISLASGTYDASASPFVWNTIKDFPLTILGSELTIIDGGGTNQGMSIDTTRALSDTSGHVTLRNIHFRNGMTPAAPGGGLFVMTRDASVALERCVFRENNASGGGAYLYSFSGTVTLTGNHVTNNTASSSAGGALFVASDAGQVMIQNNLVINNQSSFCVGGSSPVPLREQSP